MSADRLEAPVLCGSDQRIQKEIKTQVSEIEPVLVEIREPFRIVLGYDHDLIVSTKRVNVNPNPV
jgi:hypothetical protein